MRQQIQILVGAIMTSLVLMALVAAFAVQGEARFAAPPLWLLAAQFAAGGAVFLLIDAIGYRTPALDPEADEHAAASDAMGAYQSGTIMRFALAELIALASLGAAFVVEEGGVTSYATGAVVSLALTLFHAWPWSRPVDKTIASLERDGGRSGLRERLSLPPKLTGTIQEF